MPFKLKLFFLITTGLFFLLSLGFGLWLYFKTPAGLPIILHFGPLGVDFLASRSAILSFFLIMIAVLGLNFYLYYFFLKKDPLISIFMLAANLLISLLAFIAILRYFLVNL